MPFIGVALMKKNSVLFTILCIVVAACILASQHGLFDNGDSPKISDSSTKGRTASTSPFSDEESGSYIDDGEVNERYPFEQYDVVTDPDTGEQYVEGILLVYFAPSSSLEDRNEAVEQVGGEVVGRMDVFDELQIKVAATDRDGLDEAIEKLEGLDCVDMASLDYVTTMNEDITNDPWEGDGPQTDEGSWWPLAISAPRAWDAYSNQDMTDVPVAILDNGFDMNHEDLSRRLTRVSDHDSANRDVQKHGTHVAGIIGAEADNNRGITGLNWKGDILCFDIAYLDSDGEPQYPRTSIEAGLFDSVRSGAKVVNCSFGCSRNHSSDDWPNHYDLVDAYGKWASTIMGSLLAEGHDFIIVESAGNGDCYHTGIDAIYNLNFCCITASNCDTQRVSADEILGRILVVGAVEQSDGDYRLASFSNGGPRVNICAPGCNIYSTVPYNDYETSDGTSMAAPIVSGVAAMTWSANPALSGREVCQIVINSSLESVSAYPNSDYEEGTYPFVNAERAVNEALAERGVDVNRANVASINSDAHKAYKAHLDELVETSVVREGYMGLRVEHADGSTDEYYRFAVCDFNSDGIDELYYCHEATDESGNYLGILNDVYGYSPDSGMYLQWRCSTFEEPEAAAYFGNGYIRLEPTDITSDMQFYMPTSQEYAAACGLSQSTTSVTLFREEDGWHFYEQDAFSTYSDTLLTDTELNRYRSLFESGNLRYLSLEYISYETIDAALAE